MDGPDQLTARPASHLDMELIVNGTSHRLRGQHCWMRCATSCILPAPSVVAIWGSAAPARCCWTAHKCLFGTKDRDPHTIGMAVRLVNGGWDKVTDEDRRLDDDLDACKRRR
jgi:hypothetical protein